MSKKEGSRLVLHSLDKVLNSPSGTRALLTSDVSDMENSPNINPEKNAESKRKTLKKKLQAVGDQVKENGANIKKSLMTTISEKSLGRGQEGTQSVEDKSSGGELLKTGIKFTSQDAFLRFINMPAKARRSKKRKHDSEVENEEELSQGSDNPSFEASMSLEQTPPPIPPPRKKKKKLESPEKVEKISPTNSKGIDSSTVDATHRRFNKDKLKCILDQADSKHKILELSKSTSESPAKKSFLDKAKDKLSASRFRYLNEQLYTQTSSQSAKMFKEDKSLFEAYHEGFHQQANAWPSDPLDKIIAACLHLAEDQVVADLGCGEARLSRSIPNKVHSFDLVAMSPGVVECDMSKLPLKSGSVNVVVFCLSLMGTNIKDFLSEGARILEMGGLLKIAELESRFEGNQDQFIKNVQKYGFELTWKDLSSPYFYFFDFKKVKHKANKKKLPSIELKPCLYKKR
eukprot:TRINITY_DN81726_c0_g1_i1.p1 TRINITY_DN81726_c0_g1~~TRINITY_DN81726_c0_g1_i1.p1  ORF type:complete len:484 (+),score=98.49 TRINITY_DN81726_c0_g1_i1:80-1453(+)